ncbi:hypothetical protein ACFL6U_23100, partial [Planctomycetota bacterium]
MNIVRKQMLAGIAFLLLVNATSADAVGTAIAPKIGTTGIGADLVIQLTETLAGRIGGSGANLTPPLTLNNIKYDADIDLLVLNALLDWHAFKNAFRFSGGIVFNKNKFDLISTPT